MNKENAAATGKLRASLNWLKRHWVLSLLLAGALAGGLRPAVRATGRSCRR
ncbi:MAG: hypothetical protein E6X17_00075 [Sporomusaceae bacterium]|nr:hypothetical protein [Sporomusaceae bacterium]